LQLSLEDFRETPIIKGWLLLIDQSGRDPAKNRYYNKKAFNCLKTFTLYRVRDSNPYHHRERVVS
jgi:hypothetical protein